MTKTKKSQVETKAVEKELSEVEQFHENDFVRTTAIEKTNMTKTIKWIAKNKARLRFDLSIQRNTVWSLEQKSLFIHSIIYGFPFPPAYAMHSTDGQLWLLDGKQRLTTIIDFIEDKFKLSKSTPTVFGVNISEKSFSELSENIQDEILDTNFTIVEMKNMTEEERDEMFFRLNNGSTLSKIEVTRSMYSSLFAEVQEIASHTFFADIISLTDSAKNRFVDQELVLQISMLLDEGYKLKGFGGNHIRDYVLSLKEEEGIFGDEDLEMFENVSTYLAEAVATFTNKELKKALKKINVPMVFIQGKKAMEMGMKAKDFGRFVLGFLVEEYDVNSKYGQSCQSGSAKKESVLIRVSEMDKAFKKFVKVNKLELSKQEVVEEVIAVEENTEVEIAEEIAPKEVLEELKDKVEVIVVTDKKEVEQQPEEVVEVVEENVEENVADDFEQIEEGDLEEVIPF